MLLTCVQTRPKEFWSKVWMIVSLFFQKEILCPLVFLFPLHKPDVLRCSSRLKYLLTDFRAQDRKHSASFLCSRPHLHPSLPPHLALRTSEVRQVITSWNHCCPLSPTSSRYRGTGDTLSETTNRLELSVDSSRRISTGVNDYQCHLTSTIHPDDDITAHKSILLPTQCNYIDHDL